MTVWDLIQGLQVTLAFSAVALAVRLVVGAWRDCEARLYARPAQAEVLEERWFSAKAMLLFASFTATAAVVQAIRRPFPEDPVWAVNAVGIRLLLVWWVANRLRSRRRVRSLVGVTR